MTKYLAIAFLIAGITILSSCSKEPDNYDDCILKHIKSGQTKDAVWAIEEACQNKFPPKP
jgi:PBP1b-binding outer membrane lipoprotein LpoB